MGRVPLLPHETEFWLSTWGLQILTQLDLYRLFMVRSGDCVSSFNSVLDWKMVYVEARLGASQQ